MSVPENRRTQFDTSAINVGMNAVEEANKHETYADHEVYIPKQDPRAVNVVARVKKGVIHPDINDDSVSMDKFNQTVNNLQSQIDELATKESDQPEESTDAPTN